jgi:hypothetical protein
MFAVQDAPGYARSTTGDPILASNVVASAAADVTGE